MNFTVSSLEFLLAIMARMSGFIFVAPIFSLTQIPQRVKVFISAGISVIIYCVTPYKELQYQGVIAYATLIIGEIVCGMILGLFAKLSFYMLNMAGQMIDSEIGLSNVQELDPTTNLNVTITSTFLNYAVSLMLIATDMHLFIIKACVDSFELIPVGGIHISGNIFEVFLTYILDYMTISFRIVLPVFASILIVNTVLAILAKVAPQMNMFVIGHQIKIFVGLTIITIMMLFLPSISDMIFNHMIAYMRDAIPFMGGN